MIRHEKLSADRRAHIKGRCDEAVVSGRGDGAERSYASNIRCATVYDWLRRQHSRQKEETLSEQP